MKILITTDAFPPGGGGSAQSTAALARALARRGHRIHIVCSKRSDYGERRRDWEGMPVIEVGVGRTRPGNSHPVKGTRGIMTRLHAGGKFDGIRARSKVFLTPWSVRESRLSTFLKQWAPTEHFDLAHAQHWLSAKATAEASRALGFPVVMTVRDYWPVCLWTTKLSGRQWCPGCSYTRRVICVGRHYPWFWPCAFFAPPLVGAEIGRRVQALRNASAVIAVSDHVRRGLPVANAEAVPNLLDLVDMEKKLEGPVPDDLPERFVLFVGKLEPNKAPDRLLPILREAALRLPLVVAGEGSLEKRLRADALRSGQEVRFLGWEAEDVVLRLMRRATAVLFPSRWEEPLSRVLLEGLGVGAVLVVEPTGGSEEIVVDGESGLTGRTVEELAEALKRTATEEELASRLRRGAARRAKEHFSEEVVLPRMEDLYARVIGEKTPVA